MRFVDLSRIKDEEIVIRVGRALKKKYGDDIKFKTINFAKAHAIDPGFALAVASLMLGIYEFISRRKDKADSEKWSSTKLKKLIEELLLKKGIVNFKIISIEGFDRLNESDTYHCVVVVEDTKSGKRFQIVIFGDGEPSAMEVK